MVPGKFSPKNENTEAGLQIFSRLDLKLAKESTEL